MMASRYTPRDVRLVLQLMGESIAPRILTLRPEAEEGKPPPPPTRMCGGCGGTLHNGVVKRLPFPPEQARGLDADLKYRCGRCYARAAALQLPPKELEKQREATGLFFVQPPVPTVAGGVDECPDPAA